MAERFTKGTVEASVWCAKCGKATLHRIDNGLRGACLVCLKKLEDLPAVPPAAVQENLF